MTNLLVFLAFFVLAVTKVTSEDEPPGVTCIGTPLNMPDDKGIMLNDCFTQFGEKFNYGSGQEPKNITCIWVCYLKKTGLMSAENKFLKDKLAENFKAHGVPKDSIEPLAKEFAICMDTKGSTFEIKNGSCESIKETYECFGAAYNKICKPKKV